MSSTQLIIVDQPKQEPEEFTIALRAPYGTEAEYRENCIKPIAIAMTEMVRLVYGKQS